MKYLVKSCLLPLVLLTFTLSTSAQNTSPTASDATVVSSQETGENSAAKKSDKATVYVYRYKRFTGSALEPSVFCDDVQLARIDNGRYFAMKLEPGKHTFRSTDQQAGIMIDAQAGRYYFVRVDLIPGFFKGKGSVQLIQPEQGNYEIQKLKPLGADKFKDKSKFEYVPLSESAATSPAENKGAAKEKSKNN